MSASRRFEDLSDYISVLSGVILQYHSWHERINDLGSKACALSLVPAPWTPEFLVVRTAAYRKWLAEPYAREQLLIAISSEASTHSSRWLSRWPSGVLLRSSATVE
jgi:hypothetical protein